MIYLNGISPALLFLQKGRREDPHFHCYWPVRQLQKSKAVESYLPQGDIKPISTKLKKDPLLTHGMCLCHKPCLEEPKLWKAARSLNSVLPFRCSFNLLGITETLGRRSSMQGENPKKWEERYK